MSDVQLRIRIDEDEQLLAAQNVADNNSDVTYEEQPAEPTDGQPEQAIVPIVAILIGAAALAAARFIVELWHDIKGGLVIDLRPGATDNIYRDSAVPFGLIVTFTKDGEKATVDTKELPKTGTQQLIELIISGVITSATDIAKKAAELASAAAGAGGGTPAATPAAGGAGVTKP